MTESFSRQGVMRTVGASIAAVRPGEVEIVFPYNSGLTQQHGFIHAGIVSTVLDSACGYAALSLAPENAAVLTVEFKVNLLAPAKGDSFRAVGSVKKAGKTITVAEGELFAQNGDGQKLVATMTATIMSIADREGLEG